MLKSQEFLLQNVSQKALEEVMSLVATLSSQAEQQLEMQSCVAAAMLLEAPLP